MFRIFTTMAAFLRLGPREYYKQTIKIPIIEFIDNTMDIFRTRAQTGYNNTKDVVLKGTVVAFITSTLVWLSIFMYLAFYYAYVPLVSHERAVYVKFEQDGETKGVHTYPTAHVELTKRQQLLMLGQPYKVHLNLELPESPSNKEMGMFMVCADFRGKNTKLIAQSCRSAILRYRSSLFDIIYTLVYSPLYVFGASEEKQSLNIELFANYEELESEAVTDVYIEIKSSFIELYSAKFLINAEFSGLRYVMFNWPLMSAAIGITSNLFCIAIVCMISWYQLIHSEEYKNYLINKLKQRQLFRLPESVDENDSYSSSSIEDISMLEPHKEKVSDSETIETLCPDKID